MLDSDGLKIARRLLSPCCPRATRGHASPPPTIAMNSRRLIRSPQGQKSPSSVSRRAVSSARARTHKSSSVSGSPRHRPPLCNRGKCRDGPEGDIADAPHLSTTSSSELPSREVASRGRPNLVYVWLPQERRSGNYDEKEGPSDPRVLWLSVLGHLPEGCARQP